MSADLIGGAAVLKNVRIPKAAMGDAPSGDWITADIAIEDGIIAEIAVPGTPAKNGSAIIDADQGIVLPCFVDLHTHLDKGHIWPRKQNPDGTWMGALTAVGEDRVENWAARDVERRMDFALRSAYAHGTAAIRTHLDSHPPQHEITWDIFEAARDRWAGRIELQAVALMGPDQLLDKTALKSVASRVKSAGGVLGGSVAVHDKAREAIFAAVDMAGELGLDLDLHCDETGDPDAFALRHLADAVIETAYAGKVVAGHCCVLAVQEPSVAHKTIERTAEAGILVVSLPMCNLYLQDRKPSNQPATPRWRGVTLLRELKTAGAPVAIASDNTRDPFYAYGDLDGFEVFREGARILHFDHPQEEALAWTRTVGADPAAHAGFAYSAELKPGAPADFVLFRARSWSELMSRPQTDRRIFRAGQEIDARLPDYRELDDLMGMTA